MQATDGLATRAVFFDAGGTLVTASPSVGAVYALVLSRFGRAHDPGRLEREFQRAWALASTRIEPGDDRFARAGGALAFWRALLDDTLRGAGDETPLGDDELDAVRQEFCEPQSFRVFDDVWPTLEALRARGVVLGVISNWDERLPDVLADLGLLTYFKVWAVSGLEGVEKPAAAIFHRACERAGVAPAEAIHVGDSRIDDYEGALAAGLRGVWLDRGPGAVALPSAGVVTELGAILGMLEGEPS